ncbi:MFS transporter [Pseudomonas sp. PP3]|uniref:MFS transporter n=1 Tax=Pseudomonas sp. PP3 TaxID=2815936 RepID=UPI001BAFDD9C|nr:MFS transporter [Pseudomonas sp. PP3]
MKLYETHDWAPGERPAFPGSPSTPVHPTSKRFAFGAVGMLVGITGGLGNALVTVNIPYLQGTLGATTAEMAWLPAAYVMTNITINLLVVKFRQRFGLKAFTEVFLCLYALVAFAHLFANSLESAIAVRAAHGMVGAALTSLSLYYMVQAFPFKWRPRALVLGVGSTQLALPLARVFSQELLQIGEWKGLYFFELGLCLTTLGCVFLLRLPPSDRYKTFEPLDFLTFSLLAPGFALLVSVLALGRVDWWLEEVWIGWALVASIALISTGLCIEHNRINPMLMTRWLGSGPIFRLALAILLIRMVTSEQSTGAVGFMQYLDLSSDQLNQLYYVMLVGSITGWVVSALTVNPPHLFKPMAISLALMATGSIMDTFSSSITRPEQLYISQFLLAFGSMFFLGPALLMGTKNVLNAPQNYISFIVMFGITQNLGNLTGAALLGTWQTLREKYHSSYLTDAISLQNPLVADRLRNSQSILSLHVPGSLEQHIEGMRILANAVARESNIMAYNDTFALIAIVALITLSWITIRGAQVQTGNNLKSLFMKLKK